MDAGFKRDVGAFRTRIEVHLTTIPTALARFPMRTLDGSQGEAKPDAITKSGAVELTLAGFRTVALLGAATTFDTRLAQTIMLLGARFL